MKKHIAMLCAVLLTALAAFAPGAAAAGPAPVSYTHLLSWAQDI